MPHPRWLARVLVVAGSVAVLPLLPAGSASANPIMDALANTACSYGQISAAINAKSSPTMQQAANPQMGSIVEAQFGPQGQQTILQVAGTCMNY